MSNFKIDFCGKRKLFFTFSICLIVAVLAASLFMGVNLDIQFKGGSLITYSYQGDINRDEFEAVVEEIIGQGVSVQESTDAITGNKRFVVSLAAAGGMNADKQLLLSDSLSEKYAVNEIETASINVVNPTIGFEFFIKSLIALGFAAVLMMLYIGFRFKKISGLSAGVTAVLALLHDVFVVFGVFVFMGFDINANFIAVALTILGYSLSDTIVIYDRIRENKRIHGDTISIEALVNLSLNQSLKRSLMTSITTVLAMVVVSGVAVSFGVTSILTFSIPMIAGMVSGSYSSLCIAPSLWVIWQNKKSAVK